MLLDLRLKHRWGIVVNMIAFQACWNVLVIFTNQRPAWLLLLLVAVVTLAQVFWLARDPWRCVRFIGLAVVLGVLMETGLTLAGSYARVTRVVVPHPWPPLWLVGLWVNFALFMQFTLAGLNAKPFMQFVAGALGGPLACLGAAVMGAVAITDGFARGYGLIGLAWGLMCMLLFRLRREAPYRLDGRRILVTGASSGIGQALARALADAGCRVIATGRSADRLNETAAGREEHIRTVVVDQDSRAAALRSSAPIEAAFGGLDIAILNAGTCEYVDLPAFDSALVERVMHTNVQGTAFMLEAILPLLRRGETPYLVGMSSTVAWLGLPRAEAYGASKAALHYLFQSLAVDLHAEHIDVSVICPGFVKTPLTDRNDFPMPMRISAEASAASIVEGLRYRKPVIAFPAGFALIMRLLAILPTGLRTRVLAVTMTAKRKP